MQHRNIFIFNFKTQLAIIRVFRFISCFPFLIPNELTKYQRKSQDIFTIFILNLFQ
jgi:hypothetical protein